MTKKTIIFILIAVILINTIYWISLVSLEGGLFRHSASRIINLLAITDAVLIAISFMIIHLYKKD